MWIIFFMNNHKSIFNKWIRIIIFYTWFFEYFKHFHSIFTILFHLSNIAILFVNYNNKIFLVNRHLDNVDQNHHFFHQLLLNKSNEWENILLIYLLANNVPSFSTICAKLNKFLLSVESFFCIFSNFKNNTCNFTIWNIFIFFKYPTYTCTSPKNTTMIWSTHYVKSFCIFINFSKVCHWCH